LKISSDLSDQAVLLELGERLSRRRIALDLTQAQLAERAGIAKRTLERMEAGASAQLSSLVRVLRALELLESLDQLLPPAEPGPLDWLRREGRVRQRVSSRRQADPASDTWSWDDDA
jgi:transcriptional regulator with XRE-family HTH domain